MQITARKRLAERLRERADFEDTIGDHALSLLLHEAAAALASERKAECPRCGLDLHGPVAEAWREHGQTSAGQKVVAVESDLSNRAHGKVIAPSAPAEPARDEAAIAELRKHLAKALNERGTLAATEKGLTPLGEEIARLEGQLAEERAKHKSDIEALELHLDRDTGEIARLHEQVDAAFAQAAAVSEDAELYRWLRDETASLYGYVGAWLGTSSRSQNIDLAIRRAFKDATRRQGGEGPRADDALRQEPQHCACLFEWRPMPDFSGVPPKLLEECGYHATQRRTLSSAQPEAQAGKCGCGLREWMETYHPQELDVFDAAPEREDKKP